MSIVAQKYIGAGIYCDASAVCDAIGQRESRSTRIKMAINVRCGSCGSGFQAKDELAGRRVKCPKCKEPITIKAARQKAAAVASHNPLLDLLDEQNVRSVARGAVCENCGSELKPGAIVCIDCGFNSETGIQLKTEAYEDDIDAQTSNSTVSDAERIMAKAEKDIDDMPVTSEGQDFGDGADSYLIAIVAFIIGTVLIGIGLVVILTMETITAHIASSAVSFLASVLLYMAMGIWITAVAFIQKPAQGVACILTGFLWCIVFAFMQGRQLIVPAIIIVASLLIGAATGTYTSYNGWTPDSGELGG